MRRYDKNIPRLNRERIKPRIISKVKSLTILISILVCVLSIYVITSFGQGLGLMGGSGHGPNPGSGCTTDNDSKITDNAWAADDGNYFQQLVCTRLTLTATDDITEYVTRLCDNNTDTGNVVFQLYGHDAVNNYPDETAPIAGTNKSINMSAVTDCGDDATLLTVTLDATKVDVGVTTCWLCQVEENSAARLTAYDGPDCTGGRTCASADSGNTWTCSDNRCIEGEIYGCSE